ncbi:MAG: protease modulator HflC, partial [Desulfovibrionales bacterium]|nr:protease modulator HflC [Desulfovibrionales bacterium]
MKNVQVTVIGLAIAVFVLLQCIFIVDQTQRAIVLQLGKP